MNKYVNLFDSELTEWLLKAGFIQYKCQMSIIISMHQMEQKLLFCIMLTTVSIGTLPELLENGL